MSGQTVTGEALQFTDDNKHAYAYSGNIDVLTSRTKLLDFKTASTYLVAEIQPTYFTIGTSVDLYYEISLDDIVIYNVELITSQLSNPYQEIELIIPPNTRFKIEAYAASGTRNAGVILTAKVGMPQRVGNE